MMKNSASLRNSGAYTSPGTPEYGEENVGGFPKGWSSERVPLPTNNSRRHINAAFAPFNSGRTLPSKWDDAERWITSPVSGYGAAKSPISQPQRRPKSKSGPLGPPVLAYLSNYSPTMPVVEGGSVKNFVAGSPLTTGVLVPDGLSIRYGAGVAAKANTSPYAENSMTLSTSIPGLSDMTSESSLPSSQDGKLNSTKKEETSVLWDVSRRDMATQMSPEGSSHSSSKGRLSFSGFPSSNPTLVEPHRNHSSKDEVRDVQIDKGVAVARQSKKHGPRKMKKGLPNAADLPSPLDVSEASKNMSKMQREEAKITAWENLQKAKAEAAMRKLEVKLEKKRSASMDKILNRLKASEAKAQVMRYSVSKNRAQQAPKTSKKGVFFCKYFKMGSLSSCFCCHRNQSHA